MNIYKPRLNKINFSYFFIYLIGGFRIYKIEKEIAIVIK